jgi:hypothetical protein
LPATVRVAEPEPNNTNVRFVGEPARARKRVIEKPGAQRYVGVEKEHPVAPAEAHAFVDRTREATVAPPAPQGDSGKSTELGNGRVWIGKIVDDHDFGSASAEALFPSQLANKMGRVAPLVIVDYDHGQERRVERYAGAFRRPRRRRQWNRVQNVGEVRVHRDPSPVSVRARTV